MRMQPKDQNIESLETLVDTIKVENPDLANIIMDTKKEFGGIKYINKQGLDPNLKKDITKLNEQGDLLIDYIKMNDTKSQ